MSDKTWTTKKGDTYTYSGYQATYSDERTLDLPID